MTESSSIVLPLMGILLLSGVLAAILIMSDKAGWTRKVPDPTPRCPCGYNLTGNISGICPECGRRISGKL
jgi:hypothetical protein